MLAQAFKDLNRETACDRKTQAATVDGLAWISGEVQRFGTELATYAAQVTPLAQRQSTLEPILNTMNNRLCQETEHFREVHAGLVRSSNAHEDNAQEVGTMITAMPSLGGRILKIGERLDSHEGILQQLHAEIRQPTVLLEGLLCPFRGLKTDTRLTRDAPGNVMVLGDVEIQIAGRITDASERGWS